MHSYRHNMHANTHALNLTHTRTHTNRVWKRDTVYTPIWNTKCWGKLSYFFFFFTDLKGLWYSRHTGGNWFLQATPHKQLWAWVKTDTLCFVVRFEGKDRFRFDKATKYKQPFKSNSHSWYRQGKAVIGLSQEPMGQESLSINQSNAKHTSLEIIPFVYILLLIKKQHA